jgi:hypothetical protein
MTGEIYNSPVGAEVLNPTKFGAKGDGRQLTDGKVTKGSTTLESSYVFSNSDVGKEIEVEGAGPGSGLALVTTIASVTNGVATLATPAESTVSGKKVFFATDDTKAFQAAIDAANAAFLATGVTRTVRPQAGAYLLSYANGTTQATQECCLILKSGVCLDGSEGVGLSTMAPVATIVTKETATPLTAEPLEVASTSGFSETNKKLTLSLANFGNIGPTWSAKTATSFTVTQAGVHTIPVGTIVAQNRNRCMISTPKETVAEQFKLLSCLLDGKTVSAVAGGFPEENQHCLEVWGATQFEIAHNEVKRFAGKALFIEGNGSLLSNFLIHHNELHNCYANALRISAPATDFQVSDNFIHDSSREELGGVEALIMSTSLNVKRGHVTDNVFDAWGVVDIAGTEMQLQNNLIRVSTISSVPGIRILTLAKSSVSENYVDMSAATTEGQVALINESTITDTNISGNTFVGPNITAVGIIQLQFTCERLNFSDNVCVATVEGQGVRLASAQFKEVTMTGNMLRLLGGTAQALFEAPGGTFAGNVISNGRLLVQGESSAVTGNSISVIAGATTTEAMRVIAPFCTIVGNRLKGANGTNGVLRLSNAAKDCVVNANFIEATAINADWIQEESECDRNLIEGNHVVAASTGSDIVIKGANSRSRRNHGTNGTDYLSRRTVATSATILNVDELIAVTSTAAERVLTLPEAAKMAKGVTFTIKDESGGALVKNIKVVPKTPASEKIDGAESALIAVNYGKLSVYTDQANWFTV